MSTELSKIYDWKDLEVSEELMEVGKSLDKAVKLTGALELKENAVEIRKSLYHALSLQQEGPSEEGLSALDKGEERVSTRAAIASSAADTQGITGAHKDKMIAEAVQKERTALEEKAKKQQLELEEKIKESKRQLELAEKAKKEAQDKCTLADAEAKHQDAQRASDQTATRARVDAAEGAKKHLEDTLKRLKRKRQDGEEFDDDDFAEVQVTKRKKADELREERLQKAIEKAGDEQQGHELFEIEEAKREEKAKKATEKRQKKKEEELKEQFLPEMQKELKTEREKVTALETTLSELQEELREQSETSTDKKKQTKKEIKSLKTELEETKDMLDTKHNDCEVAREVIKELISNHGIDRKLVKSIAKTINERRAAEQSGDEQDADMAD
jgi:DNA repair exonuclease SbcCD ATPase subunit